MKIDLEHHLREQLSSAYADGLACSRNLYAYAAGELSPAEATRFEHHVRECPACRLDLASFHRSPVPADSNLGRWRRWIGRGFVVAGVAATFVLALWQWQKPVSNRASKDVVSALHTKGAPQVQIAVRRGAQDFVAASGQIFANGDTLGFFYSSAEPVWPVIFTCTQEGSVVRIYPTAEPELLPPASNAPLPAGAVVEPSSGCEWLVAVLSPEALRPSYDQVIEALRKALASQGAGCALAPMIPGMTTQVWPLLRGPSR
jgi:hypothetical protein